MQSSSSPQKKLKSPVSEITNYKTSIRCINVPESLFDTTAAKKHFSKFGRVQKIHLYPKRHQCVIEYDQPLSAEKAVLNAGAFDGFMFDVTRAKPRIRRRSKKDDDPDWVPDSEVEEELSAMSGAPSYMLTRQKVMDVDTEIGQVKLNQKRITKQSPIKKTVVTPKRTAITKKSGIESPVPVAITQTSLTTAEAAMELNQLRSKVCLTPDEQWRVLDARDRVLRAWGGTGARKKRGGATIGTCPDKCPEKERLHRQAEHQVMTLETVPESDGQLDMWRAVKQYSRSSADQEIPMCYELRSATVLMSTCAYLLHEIADTKRQVTLADWFHFMWDRFRGIRKDITQQAMCCADSIKLVEMCARFHAHCAARLADLEHTQFDQKLNTDNLTKCLQTLKHMYADVESELKPKEAEFRGYIALLNLGDANFWWEIKQLPENIQKSEAITFAIQIFNALDNNNYVRFFRLIKEKATYLQACILLRYFNDVRARALARIVKAYAPRGGSRYPAVDLINALCFETTESMKSFISHYGLRFSKHEDTELSVILDRNHFIEDSDPYPLSRAVELIESKRQNTVGEIIAGGTLPHYNFDDFSVYTSFNTNGVLKETSLIAEDQGFNTLNDTNKDVQSLKSELKRLVQGGKVERTTEVLSESKNNLVKPLVIPKKSITTVESNTLFSFKPAIPIAPLDVMKDSPGKIFQDTKRIFSFSKPDETVAPNLNKAVSTVKTVKEKENLGNNLFSSNQNNVFIKRNHQNNLGSIFSTSKDEVDNKLNETRIENKPSQSIFGNYNKNNASTESNIFAKSDNKPKQIFGSNESGPNMLSPGSLFKSANQVNGPNTTYTIFQSKNKPTSVANNIFQSINSAKNVYEFDSHDDNTDKLPELQQHFEEPKSLEEVEKLSELQQVIEERARQEEIRKEQEINLEMKRKENQRQEEKRIKEEEERKKQEELKALEEKRRKEEERKQEELRQKIKEEKRKEEEKRKAEVERKLRIEKESSELVDELIEEVTSNNVELIMKEESDNFKCLMSIANNLTEELINDTCHEIVHSEVKAVKIWIKKLWKKYFSLWRNNVIRNVRRRILLEDVPIWLSETPAETAARLRRCSEDAALNNMNAILRGYRFTGELKYFPIPEPLKIMEIIKTPLLRRMRIINYPYDKCFFWKITLVSEGWLYKKINITKWLLDAFGDKKHHDVSKSLIHVSKNSWNNLMDFAVSVSITDGDNKICSEAMEGTNGMLYYITENNLMTITDLIKRTLRHKYPYQLLPLAILIENIEDYKINELHDFLIDHVKEKNISAYKLFIIGKENVSNSLITVTKSALKWLAKKCPQNPPLETDYLRSICERYLGNEFWQKIKYRDGRIKTVIQDLHKLVKCYNLAVDNLIGVVTNEDLFNHPSFPLEFKQYLNVQSPYPKPYEFIDSNTKNSGNIASITNIMQQMKLPVPISGFNTKEANSLMHKVQNYCYQIGWGTRENSEEVGQLVAVLPNTHSDVAIPRQLNDYLKCYNLTDLLNIIIYEKINKLKRYDKLFVVYERSVLESYSNMDWLYNSDLLTSMKHKILEYEDDIDYLIEAKRQRLAIESMEYFDLEEQDCTLVENNVNAADESISKYKNCQDSIEKLEQQIDEEQKKSINLENLLRSALSDV